MKQIFYSIAACIILASCYDDQSGNDFDTPLANVEITIPESAYSGSLGSTFTIEPSIKTQIDEKDLEYFWEVNGNLKNDLGRSFYTNLVPIEKQSKVLNFTCCLDKNITSLNQSYTCRLRAHQLSTGRDFYSTNTFTITIEGITGLMVLHGDDQSSEIGILVANEFMPASSSLPSNPTATPTTYSNSNNGEKIAGKGINIVQSVVTNLDWATNEIKDRCRIMVKTDKGVSWIDRNSFAYYGDWNKLFYLTGSEKINKGIPEGCIIDGGNVIAFDGGDVFIMAPSGEYPFLFPNLTSDIACGDGNKFEFAPFLNKVDTRGVQSIMFARKINNKVQKGFLALSNSLYSPATINSYIKLIDTKGDKTIFNPGDMKADLITMVTDNRKHTIAVLKGDENHPTYANKLFAVDLYPNAETSGESGYANVPQYSYDLSTQPNINNALTFAFGPTQNMCYYATPSNIYHYGLDASSMSTATALDMTNGETIKFDGEITMMKLLDSPNISTHNSEPILLVATYNNGNATLYALHIETMTGKVLSASVYNKETVSGWNFNRITDVNIKSL